MRRRAARSLAAGGLTDINFGLTALDVVLFVLFAFVMTKLGWKPLLAIIEEREKGIREAVEGAQKAQHRGPGPARPAQGAAARGRPQREEIIKRAIADAEQLRGRPRGPGQGRVASRWCSGPASRSSARSGRAIQELRAQVADLAVQAASRIVESSLTPDAQRKLVDEFIESCQD